MARFLVLVTSDPPLTRAAIVVALQELRPEIDTITGDPAVPEHIARYQPDVAIITGCHEMVETPHSAAGSGIPSRQRAAVPPPLWPR